MTSFDTKNSNSDSFNFDLESESQSYFDDTNDEYKKGFKLYNFRRPDKFSKDHLKGLQDIHREFSRQLSLTLTAYLRMHLEVDVVSVDQLTYDEFVRSMPTPVTIGIFELAPLPGQVLLGIGFEVLSAIVDRMLGGTGICENTTRELTDIEESLAKKLIERTIKTLELSWEHIIPVKGNIVRLEKDYNTVQIASPSEIVALITFEIQVGGKYFGLMSFCFTYPFLENILTQLTTQHIYQAQGIIANTDEQKNMIEKLNTTNADINVILGNSEITMADFLSLKIGDVIKLKEKINDDLVVKINNQKKFFARAGKVKNKISVKITNVYDEATEILKSYS